MSTNPNDDATRFEATITGRVQGVGFRHFTRTNARDLGLEGWVRNEPDGSVTVVAEGPKRQLEKLEEEVRTGPRTARVDGIEVDWTEARDEFDTFQVRFH
jgi:acylphosphatase